MQNQSPPEVNLGLESLNLFQAHEARVHQTIDQKGVELERFVGQMEDLEKFLGQMAARSEDSVRLDFGTTPEDMDYVDSLRGNPELAHIFPNGKYVWKEGEIENLRRLVNQHVEGALQRKIANLTEETVLEQHELNKVLDMFKNMQTRLQNLNETIMRNVQRAN